MTTSSNNLVIYVQNVKAITIDSLGGQLHGQWEADATIEVSDRRLKREIYPLHRSLFPARKAGLAKPVPRSSADSSIASEFWKEPSSLDQNSAMTQLLSSTAISKDKGYDSSKAGAVDWLLRELRPVSFRFREGRESKYIRYGFVAQEVEKILPNLVRTKKDTKAILYSDLVALLTLASQVHNERLSEFEARAAERGKRLGTQASLIETLRQDVSRLTGRFGQPRASDDYESNRSPENMTWV